MIAPYNRRGGSFRIINGRRFFLEIVIFQSDPVAIKLNPPPERLE